MSFTPNTSVLNRVGAAGNSAITAISSKGASYFIRNYRSSLPALFALMLFLLGLLIYAPVLPGGFIMDDLKLVQWDNPIVNGTTGPGAIWFRADFPLSTLVFWLEWKAWGTDPLGYHLINITLHGLSAFVLWLVLIRLRVRGAGLAALLYLAHPVCVGTVARVAELKNTLSMPLFLLSAWAYLGYERKRLFPTINGKHANEGKKATAYYTISVAAFVLALLAKTAVVMLPVVLLACALWQRGRLVRKDLLHTAPHFALSLGFGAMSAWFQKWQALGGESLASHSLWYKAGIAARSSVFYLEKTLWPVKLNIIYPRWDQDGGVAARAWASVLVLCAVAAGAWLWRARGGKHVLFGMGAFLAILFPALGFFDAQFLRNWQVSDHLQYAAIVAPIALFAAAISSLPWERVSHLAIPATVGVLTFASNERVRFFQTEEGLLRDALSKNPAAWAAHNDLGCLEAQQNRISDAARCFELSLRHNPDFPDAHLNLGQALLCLHRPAEAETHFAAVLRHNPAHAGAHSGVAKVLLSRNCAREAVVHLRAALRAKPDPQTYVELAAVLYQKGDRAEAIVELRHALSLNPEHAEALNNIAWLLATAPQAQERHAAEAMQCAKRACVLAHMKDPHMLGTLAAAYADAGRFEQAIRTAEKAASLADGSGEPHFAAAVRQLLGLYRQKLPYREKA